jgi:rhodanese-related sulfurtransferase
MRDAPRRAGGSCATGWSNATHTKNARPSQYVPPGLSLRRAAAQNHRATLIREMSGGDQTAILEIDPERVQAWLEEEPDLQLVDVRESYEREAGYIDGSRHIQLTKLSSEAATLERERPVVFYCRVGSRSGMAAQALRTAGFDAYSMTGGILRWAREQRALTPDDGYVAEH